MDLRTEPARCVPRNKAPPEARPFRFQEAASLESQWLAALSRAWCWDLRGSYSGWIIAGCAGDRVGGCGRLKRASATKIAFRNKEGEIKQSVYRIDAAAQTARCHDHHFGCWRGITQSQRHPSKTGGKYGRERSTHRAALDHRQSRRTRPRTAGSTNVVYRISHQDRVEYRRTEDPTRGGN